MLCERKAGRAAVTASCPKKQTPHPSAVPHKGSQTAAQPLSWSLLKQGLALVVLNCCAPRAVWRQRLRRAVKGVDGSCTAKGRLPGAPAAAKGSDMCQSTTNWLLLLPAHCWPAAICTAACCRRLTGDGSCLCCLGRLGRLQACWGRSAGCSEASGVAAVRCGAARDLTARRQVSLMVDRAGSKGAVQGNAG
jgi:hypothetical protein